MKDPRLSTSDFVLGAILLVEGFCLVGIEPDPADPGRRRRFILSGDPAAFTRLSRQLLLDDVLVPARAFALAQRQLKRLLYAESPGRTP